MTAAHRAVPGRRGHASRGGMSIFECIISLAIAAMLLTAAASAYSASGQAMEQNDQFFRAAQCGRTSMARILSQLRRGDVDEASTANNLHLVTDNGQDVTYKLVPETNPATGPMRLVMVIDAGKPTEKTHELARNVTTQVGTHTPFSVVLGKNNSGADCVARVSVTLSVKVGNNEILLSSAAAPRRSLAYSRREQGIIRHAEQHQPNDQHRAHRRAGTMAPPARHHSGDGHDLHGPHRHARHRVLLDDNDVAVAGPERPERRSGRWWRRSRAFSSCASGSRTSASRRRPRRST